MKNTRKLIPALAMLLVSAVMMSTASFAWFTMNSTVTADNITVTAVAPASLWIAQNVDSGDPVWGTTMDFSNENRGAAVDALIPSKTTSGKVTYGSTAFQKLTDAALQQVPSSGQITNPQDGDFEASNSYFMDAFVMKLDSQLGDTATINANVTISYSGNRATPDEIYKALRVGIVAQGTQEGTIFAFTNSTLAAAQDTTTPLLASVNQDGIFTLAAGQTTNVEIYVWLEGDDINCKNANALNCDDFDFEVVFSYGNITKPSSGGGSGTT